MYTNADSLLNKMTELHGIVNCQDKKPHIIAITEVKPKTPSVQSLPSEYKSEGYNFFTREQSRGIIVYVANEIHATQLEIDS